MRIQISEIGTIASTVLIGKPKMSTSSVCCERSLCIPYRVIAISCILLCNFLLTTSFSFTSQSVRKKKVFGKAEWVLLEIRKMQIFTGVCQNILVSAEIGRIKIFLFGDLHAFLHAVKVCVLLQLSGLMYVVSGCGEILSQRVRSLGMSCPLLCSLYLWLS